MSLYKRGGVWWYQFVIAGKRVRESANTSRKTIALQDKRSKRLDLERALSGIPVEKRENRILSVADCLKRYKGHYRISHRPKSVAFMEGRLAHVERLLANVLLPELTDTVIRTYMQTRLDDKVSGRTINMEIGELSRAIGKPWSVLWPKVRKLEERKDVGRALSPEEEGRLLETAAKSKSKLIETFVRIALSTGMRAGEIATLRWEQVDFAGRVIRVGQAKTASGTGRQIPMNQDVLEALKKHAVWFT